MGLIPGRLPLLPLLLPLPPRSPHSNPRFESHTHGISEEPTFNKYLKQQIRTNPRGAQCTSAHHSIGRRTVIVHSPWIHQPNPREKRTSISHALTPHNQHPVFGSRITHKDPTASGTSFGSMLSPSVVPFVPPIPLFLRVESNSFS